MIAVPDTSDLLALFNRTDPEHRQAATVADACGLLVVSPLRLVEVHQVASIRADRRTADAILGTVAARAESTRIAIAKTTPRPLNTTLALRRRYADLYLSTPSGSCPTTSKTGGAISPARLPALVPDAHPALGRQVERVASVTSKARRT
jgi:predicted nucleic acid-binding protein